MKDRMEFSCLEEWLKVIESTSSRKECLAKILASIYCMCGVAARKYDTKCLAFCNLVVSMLIANPELAEEWERFVCE